MNTIKLRIEEEKELYNHFDPDGTLLSEDVKTYVLSQVTEKPMPDPYTISIVSPAAVDEDRVRLAFKRWIAEEENAIKEGYKRNLFQQLWMFTVGVIFITLSLFLKEKVSVVWFTVLSTIGAYSMWEAASIWIIHNPRLRRRLIMVKKLKNDTRITIKR